MPLGTIIYSDAYKNISGQVLEIDNGVSIYPGHVWSQLLAALYLTDQQANFRGYATQKLIDRGFIGRSTYIPIFQSGNIYFQATDGSWFQAFSEEYNPITTGEPLTSSQISQMVYKLVAVDSSAINPSWILDYNILFSPGVYLAMALPSDPGFMLTMGVDLVTANSFIFRKNPIPSGSTIESSPVAFSNSVSLVFE